MLIHIAEFEKYRRKAFILMLKIKNVYFTHLKIYIRLLHFLENGKKKEG